MLDYEEDEGILWLSTMLASQIKVSDSKDIVVSMDDCDCEKCRLERGNISIDRSVYVNIPLPDGKVVHQRLTLKEADILGRALIAYSENLSVMMEEE